MVAVSSVFLYKYGGFNMLKINEKIKSLRIEKHKTQEEVSERIGINIRSYQRLENGDTKNPSLDTLIKLADYYNVSLDYLVGRSND